MYPECLVSINLELAEPFISSNYHHNIRCLECNDIFVATPKSKMANYKKSKLSGCPKCTKDKQFKEEKDNIRNTLKELGFVIDGQYRSKLDYVMAKNTNCTCGRWWKTKPVYLKSGRSFCKPCNDDKKRTRFDTLNEDRKISYDGTIQTYKREVNRLTRMTYINNINIINPNGHKRVRSDEDGYQLDHIIPIVTCHRHNVPPELCASVYNLRMVNRMDNAKKWSKPTESIPHPLLPYFNDIVYLTNMLKLFLTDNNITFSENKNVEGFTYNFAIGEIIIMICSFNLYKEQSLKSKKFLADAKRSAESNNYTPIFIFENEITNGAKFDIIKSRLLNILKRIPTVIYGRKCSIKKIDTTTKTAFLNDNHIQGAVGSTHNYGLIYNDDLVAIMTFSMRREFLSIGEYNTMDDYELLRYATKKNVNVVGGASKLLKHFISEVSPRTIMSFSDNRWGKGNVYNKLGMSLTHTTDPNYWYIIDNNLHYRYKYRKNTLEDKLDVYDANKSEYQNMLANGYDRIWDCGSSAFLLTIDK